MQHLCSLLFGRCFDGKGVGGGNVSVLDDDGDDVGLRNVNVLLED